MEREKEEWKERVKAERSEREERLRREVREETEAQRGRTEPSCLQHEELGELRQRHEQQVAALTHTFDLERDALQQALEEARERLVTLGQASEDTPTHTLVASVGEEGEGRCVKEEDLVREKKEEVMRMEKEVEERCEELGRREEEVRRREEEVAERVRELEAQTGALSSQLEERDRQMERTVEEYKHLIKEKDRQMEKDANLVRNLEIQLKGREAELRDMEAELKDKEAELVEKKVELEQLLSVRERAGAVEGEERGERERSDGMLREDSTETELRSKVGQLEACLREKTASHERELTSERSRHRREFERAARHREEKFQSELRYFLQEREERGRREVEERVRRELEERVRREVEEKVRREVEERVRREVEERSRGAFEKAMEEYREKSEEEKERLRQECEERVQRAERRGREEEEGKTEDTHTQNVGEKESMNKEVRRWREKLEEMERKMKGLREEKMLELSVLSQKHKAEIDRVTEEWRTRLHTWRRTVEEQKEELREKDRENKRLKEEREEEEKKLAQMSGKMEGREQEMERRKEDKEEREKDNRSERRMTVTRKLFDTLYEEEEGESGETERVMEEGREEEIERRVRERVTEERSRWLQDAQSYISGEIQMGIEDRERGQADEWERQKKEVEEKLTKEVQRIEREKKQLEERVKEEEEKREKQKDLERVMEERRKERMREVKERVEREVKERVREEVGVEVQGLKQKFVTELEARVVRERSQTQAEVHRWREEARRKMDREKERLEEEMRTLVTYEKKKIEEEVRTRKEEELREVRAEMEEEMRRRIQKQRREWEEEEAVARKEGWKKKKEKEEEGREEGDGLKKQLQAEKEGRAKERERLTTGLSMCQSMLERLRAEHRALEERYTQMDRKYKLHVLQARRKTEELEDRLKERKEGKGMEEKVLGEVPEAESILELRDHYLQTVARIKADVTSHVQEANSRAADTLRSEVRRQRARMATLFKVNAKVILDSHLAGQVTASSLRSIHASIEALCQQLVSSSPRSDLSDPSPAAGDTHHIPVGDTHHIPARDTHHTPADPRPDNTSGPVGGKAWSLGTEEPVRRGRGREGAGGRSRSEERRRIGEHGGAREGRGAGRDRSEEGQRGGVDGGERERATRAQDSNHRLPQLDRVALFDSDTPPRSPTSSPRDLGGRATSVSRPVGEVGESFSPRDERKMVEARVRLSRWAANGDTPWDYSVSATPHNGHTGGGKGHSRVTQGHSEVSADVASPAGGRGGEMSHDGGGGSNSFHVVSGDRGVRGDSLHQQGEGHWSDDASSVESEGSFVTLVPEGGGWPRTVSEHWPSDGNPRGVSRCAAWEANPDLTEGEWGVVGDIARIKAAVLGPPTGSEVRDVYPLTPDYPTSTPVAKVSLSHKTTTGSAHNSHSGSAHNSHSGSPHNSHSGSAHKTPSSAAPWPCPATSQPPARSEPPVRGLRSSVGQGRGEEDFVLRSAEFCFPSELSRISRGSEPWKYRSLEDLLARDGRGQGSGRGLGYAGLGPVQAMTESFWRNQSQPAGADEGVTPPTHHPTHHPGGQGHHAQTVSRSRSQLPARGTSSQISSFADEELEYRAGGVGARAVKMSRSTSEQSLHTLPGRHAWDWGVGGNGGAQPAATTVSQLDLRPFALEEHF
ncbi:trichohyalin [Aplysia californica]|uniref:Trichohyalin n=1 Tax=Aplysia californica TaxID=6500 RepID=A0ABM1W018_APLCA|nr:trichohyalin [Aplysia californica]